jgi:hypothetical protein
MKPLSRLGGVLMGYRVETREEALTGTLRLKDRGTDGGTPTLIILIDPARVRESTHTVSDASRVIRSPLPFEGEVSRFEG